MQWHCCISLTDLPIPCMLYVLSSRAGRRSWGTAHTTKEDFCPLFPGLDGCSPSCCLWAPAILQWLQSQPQSAVSDALRLAQSTGKNIFWRNCFLQFWRFPSNYPKCLLFFFFFFPLLISNAFLSWWHGNWVLHIIRLCMENDLRMIPLKAS